MKMNNVVGVIFLIGCSLTVFNQNFPSAYAEKLDSSHHQISNWDPFYPPDPPSEDFGWVDECFSDYHTIMQCVLDSGYNPFDAANGEKFDVDSECCEVLKEFDNDCVSESASFDVLSRSFSWMRDSCRRHHHHHQGHHHRQPRHRRHGPPSPHSPSPKPTPPSPTPTPPSSKPTPTSPTPSPPSPTPTPPSVPTPSPPSP